jgi:hypothetical protein
MRLHGFGLEPMQSMTNCCEVANLISRWHTLPEITAQQAQAIANPLAFLGRSLNSKRSGIMSQAILAKEEQTSTRQ